MVATLATTPRAAAGGKDPAYTVRAEVPNSRRPGPSPGPRSSWLLGGDFHFQTSRPSPVPRSRIVRAGPKENRPTLRDRPRWGRSGSSSRLVTTETPSPDPRMKPAFGAI